MHFMGNLLLLQKQVIMSIITIYNVTIDTDIIVGVGPLMRIQRVNDPLAMVHQQATYKFDIFTKHYILSISTDTLSFFGGPGSSQYEDSKRDYSCIKAAWELLRNNMRDGYPLDLGWDKLNEENSPEMPT